MINYSLISKSIKKYKKLGYQYIDVPWVVPKDIINITIPRNKRSFQLYDDNHLVGSAEQSFLYMILNKSLKSGKYVAASPCFRDDQVDYYHKKYFFKVELINYSENASLNKKDVDKMISDVKNVLLSFTNNKIKILNIDNLNQDLEIDGVEIGSYGLRSYENFNWVYGTGIAEPRFSQLNG